MIGIVSDVLLQHHSVITRKWLSGLIQYLKSKGFTTVAVVNPQMHTKEDMQAILGLFDGEIDITSHQRNDRSEKTIRVSRLQNQNYDPQEVLIK